MGIWSGFWNRRFVSFDLFLFCFRSVLLLGFALGLRLDEYEERGRGGVLFFFFFFFSFFLFEKVGMREGGELRRDGVTP